jgi:hypothetical protein
MRARTQQVVAGHVLVFWRDRFAYLREKLTRDPHDENSWFWRVQWDILNYLLHRYAGEELQMPPLGEVDAPFAQLAERGRQCEKQSELTGPALRYRGSAKPPRDSSAIRSFLTSIVDGNQERHTVLQHLRDELAKEKILQRSLNREVIGWMKEYRRIYGAYPETPDETPSAPEQLTEDEIVEALSELINLDRPPEESEGSDDDAKERELGG